MPEAPRAQATHVDAGRIQMETFIWVILIIIGFESVVKIACLAIGFNPPRSNTTIAADVVIGAGLLVWGAILLHGA